MAGPVKGQWAGEEITLNDAATEVTLQAILDAITKQGNQKRDRKSTGRGRSGADTDNSDRSVSRVFSIVTKPLNALAGTSKILQSAFRNVTGAAAGLGEELLIGGDQLSDFTQHITGAIATIPIFGSAVGGLTQLFVSVIDNQIGVFRGLTSVGVDFGGSLFDMQHAATKANLSLDTYQQVVTSNAETLALMRGSAAAGARSFTQISGIVQQSGERFAALGMTIEETAQFTADYLALQTRLGRAQQMDQAQLASGAEAYIMQLDKLSKITGKQREQIAQEMQQQAMDKRLQAMFAGMDEAQAMQLQGMLSLIDGASPDIAEATRELMATGGVPVSDFAKSMVRANGNLASMTRGLMDGSISAEQYQAELRRTAAAQDDMSMETRRQIGILESQGNAALSANRAFIGLSNLGLGAAEALSAQEEAANRGNAGLLAFQRNLQTLRNTIIGALLDSGIFQGMEKGFSGLLDTIMGINFKEVLEPIINGLARAFRVVSGVINAFIKDIKEVGIEEAFKNLWNDSLKPAMESSFDFIKVQLMKAWTTTIWPELKKAFAGMREAFIERWPEMKDALKTLITDNLGTIGKILLGAIVAVKFGLPVLIGGLIITGLTKLFGADIWKSIGSALLRGIMDNIGTITKFLIGGILGAIVAVKFGIPALVVGLVITGIGKLFGPDIWESIKSGISGAWTSLIEGITSIPKKISELFTWEKLAGVFLTAIDTIYFIPNKILELFNIAPVSELMGAAFERILAVPSKIIELFAPVGEFFQPAVDMMSTVARMIQNLIQGIGNFISDMIDKIPGAGALRRLFGRRGDEEELAAEELSDEQPNRYDRIRQREERRRAVMANRGLAPEVSDEDARAARSQAGDIRNEMAGMSEAERRQLAILEAQGSTAAQFDRALTTTTAFDQALASTNLGLEDASTKLGEIRQQTARLREVDVDELSSYNKQLTRTLERIETQTGGGETVTDRDGTQTRIAGEDSVSAKKQMETLNTNLSQLLAAVQEGNKIGSKSYQVQKKNTNTMW